ncbi:hypothetical protein [Pediococcus pentosaceus]|uniref:hypothetical protein n=1 Tax=Pediococcus pentosaceus TaxID=1255 RepID=UPI001319F4F9|nr:hypothetical protein [Pediococcus pentosaceus]MBF7133621.1 hypothetical protein [Pediococcus pentosaceus]QPT36957.1 hypothetical protein I6G30_03380 [Pediococcus pentosaceus]
MKLAKIGKNTYINPERIDSIEYYPSVDVTNVVINGYSIRLEETTIKKVLDAICGSEEHLEKNEQIISEVINNLKKIDNISSVKIEYIRSDLGQPGGFLVQKN